MVTSKMEYNYNIILEILRSAFWKEIEIYVKNYVLGLETDQLMDLFQTSLKFAMLHYIEEMGVADYEVGQQEEQKYISGTLNVTAEIDCFIDWDGEDEWDGTREIEIVIDFGFYEKGEKYFDLELLHLYDEVIR